MALKLYLAGKMRGIKHFNRQAFADAATVLRAYGHVVFSPPEYAEAIFGPDILLSNETGNQDDSAAFGIEGDKMFLNELAFIIQDADAVIVLDSWKESKGATAERAVALAVGKSVLEYSAFVEHQSKAVH